MGKLAERYADVARSGVYRVRDAAIPRAAAAEANAVLLEFSVPDLADGSWDRVQQAIAARRVGPRVVVIADAGALAQPEHRALLDALHAAARACRDAGRPFFAVLVDPGDRLPLQPLYKERAEH